MVAKCRAQGMDTLDTAQKLRGTQNVYDNPKIDWTLKEEELKDEKGCQMQKNVRRRKVYFAPDGTHVGRDIPLMKKDIPAVNGSTQRRGKTRLGQQIKSGVRAHICEGGSPRLRCATSLETSEKKSLSSPTKEEENCVWLRIIWVHQRQIVPSTNGKNYKNDPQKTTKHRR